MPKQTPSFNTILTDIDVAMEQTAQVKVYNKNFATLKNYLYMLKHRLNAKQEIFLENEVRYEFAFKLLDNALKEVKKFISDFSGSFWFVHLAKFNFSSRIKTIYEQLGVIADNLNLYAPSSRNFEPTKPNKSEEVIGKYEEEIPGDPITQKAQQSINSIIENAPSLARETRLGAAEEEKKRIQAGQATKLNIDPAYLISFLEIRILSVISEDDLLKTYKAEYRGKLVMVKMMREKFNEDQLKDFEREARNMSKLKAKNIVKFIGAGVATNQPFIVMRYMPVTLLDLINSKEPLTLEQKISIALGIVAGLRYLHLRGIWHRNLKSGSIYIDENKVVKIADFSKLKVLTGTERTVASMPEGSEYMPPEVLANPNDRRLYSDKTDIYSLGIILWELFNQKKAFATFATEKVALSKKIREGYREKISVYMPPPFAMLIAKTWEVNPDSRMSINDIATEIEKFKTINYELINAEKKYANTHPSEVVIKLMEDGKQAEKYKDYIKAVYCYTEAKKLHYYKAYRALGMLLRKGLGLVKDPAKALDYFLIAARYDDVTSLWYIAQMFHTGEGTPANPKNALYYYQYLITKIIEIQKNNQTMGDSERKWYIETKDLAEKNIKELKNSIVSDDNSNQVIIGDVSPPTSAYPADKTASRREVLISTEKKLEYHLIDNFTEKEARKINKQTGANKKIGDSGYLNSNKEGNFAVVQIARDKRQHRFAVVKTISGNKDSIEINAMRYEAEVQKKIAGLPNIESILDSAEVIKEQQITLSYVFPYYSYGSLNQVKKYLAALPNTQQALKEKIVSYIAHELLQGEESMNQKQIYHCDIKPGNVMLDQQGCVFYIDFGSAIDDTQPEKFRNNLVDFMYLAPERIENFRQYLKQQPVGKVNLAKADVWSIGLTIYELLTGQHFVERLSREKVISTVTKGFLNEKLRSIPQFKDPNENSIWHLLKYLLMVDPDQRFSVKEALMHPALNSNTFESQEDRINTFTMLEKNYQKVFTALGKAPASSNVTTAPARMFQPGTERVGYDLSPASQSSNVNSGKLEEGKEVYNLIPDARP